MLGNIQTYITKKTKSKHWDLKELDLPIHYKNYIYKIEHRDCENMRLWVLINSWNDDDSEEVKITFEVDAYEILETLGFKISCNDELLVIRPSSKKIKIFINDSALTHNDLMVIAEGNLKEYLEAINILPIKKT